MEEVREVNDRKVIAVEVIVLEEGTRGVGEEKV